MTERLAVAKRIGAALVLMAVWFAAGWFVGAWILDAGGQAPIAVDTPGVRLAFAARWLVLPVLSLILAVGLIARHRHLKNAIEGGWDSADRTLEAYRRNLANTVEQVLIAAPAYAAFATVAPIDWLRLLPAAATLFLVARVAFLIGLFRDGARHRAIGFACTFYPSVALTLAALAFWVI